MGGQQARALCPAGGAGGQDAVGPGQVGVDGVELAQVGADGAGVAAGDRPGERAVAVPQRVVQRGRQQRRDEPLGGMDAGPLQDVDAVAHERDQVVGAVREGGVVERADGLGHADRLGAHLDDKGLADAPSRLLPGRRRDRDARTGEPGDVLGTAGEGHDRVQGQREHAVRGGRVEHGDALRTRGVHDDLAGPEAPRGGKTADQAGQDVVGHGEQDEVRSGGGLVGGHEGDAGQERLGPVDRRPGDPGGGDDPVAGGGQRGADDGPDPAGGDHADGEPGGPACTHPLHSSSVHSAAPRVDAAVSRVAGPRYRRREGGSTRRPAGRRSSPAAGTGPGASRAGAGAAGPSPRAAGAARPR